MPISDDLDERLQSAAGPAPEVEPALARVLQPQSTHARPYVAAAAVLLVVAIVSWAAVQWQSDDRSSVRAGRSANADSPVEFRVLAVVPSSRSIGTVRSASTTAEIADLWTQAEADGEVPSIDLDREVVVTATIAGNNCPPKLDRFVRDGPTLEPRFVQPAEACEDLLVRWTYVVALAWESRGEPFTLVVPTRSVEHPTARLHVDRDAIEPLTARVVLSSNTVAAGASLDGTIEFHNNTGGLVRYTFCGEPFVLSLANETIRQQLPPQPFCGESGELATGESTFPIRLDARHGDCDPPESRLVCQPDGQPPALPPGRYTVSIDYPAMTPTPALDPLIITIT